MKKVFKLFVMAILFLPFYVSAINQEVNLVCNDAVLEPGGTTTCYLSANVSDGYISAFGGNITLGDNLSFVSFTRGSSFTEGDGDEGDIQIYTLDSLTGNIDIGSFVVKAGNNAGVSSTVGISSAYLSVVVDGNDEDLPNDEDSPVDIPSTSIRIASNSNTLSDITVNDTSIEGFNSSINTYTFDVDPSVTSINIGATATESSSTISGDIGNKELSYGQNVFNIVVISELGYSNTYTLKVVRPDKRELVNLEVNGNFINLINGVYEYSLKVDNNVTSVDIVAEINEGNYVSFVDNFGPRTVSNLKVGNNPLYVKVADASGNELVYTINVDRLNAEGKDVAPKEEKKGSGSVENPKTGVYGVSVLLIAGVAGAYIIARKKGFINKI